MERSELSPLGIHLNDTIKEKIWKGDYVDILTLRPSNKYYRAHKEEGNKFDYEKRRSAAWSFNN